MVTAEAIENRGKEDGAHFTDFNPVCIAFELKANRKISYNNPYC